MPDPLVDPRSLRDAIAREESRLIHLQTEFGHAHARLATLKTTFAAHEGAVENAPLAPSTAKEKIALFRSRSRGRNTVFVDNQFVPHPDQWWFLSTHPRIDPATVERVAHEAMRQGLVVGVRLSDTSNPETLEPWTRRPSGQPPIRFAAPLPPPLHRADPACCRLCRGLAGARCLAARVSIGAGASSS